MRIGHGRIRLIVGLVIFGLAAALVALAVQQGWDLHKLQASRGALMSLRHAYPIAAAVVFFFGYTLITAFSLPVATLVTLAAGAVFGFVEGFILVSFASTLGVTLAMLASRFLFRDWVRSHGGTRVARIERGLQQDGAFYLFSLRLVPAVPFVFVNLLSGLAPIRLRTYWWVSQLGMLPATLVYANAGQRLAAVSSLSDLLSPMLVGSLLLLAILPWLARFLAVHMRLREHRRARRQKRKAARATSRRSH